MSSSSVCSTVRTRSAVSRIRRLFAPFLSEFYWAAAILSALILSGCELQKYYPQNGIVPFSSGCPEALQSFTGASLRFAQVQLNPGIKQFELLDSTGTVVTSFIGQASNASLMSELNDLAGREEVQTSLTIEGYYRGEIEYQDRGVTVTLDCVLEVDGVERIP